MSIYFLITLLTSPPAPFAIPAAALTTGFTALTAPPRPAFVTPLAKPLYF
jgi:hypothetical protein